MKDLELHNGDCLEVMDKLIEEGVQVDAIITDPPYGTIKNIPLDGYKNHTTGWDIELDITKLHTRFNRVLKEKGVLLLFSQEPYTTSLIQSSNKNLPFSYRMIWEKDHFANPLAAKKAPVSYYEDINIFFKKYDIYNKNPLRVYFQKVQEFIGLSLKEINKALHHRKAEHSFYISSTQFKLMTEQVYQELVSIFRLSDMVGFIEYATLKKDNSKYEPTFNLWEGKKYKSNILKYKKDYQGLHPTQKPLLLMEDLIKTYTNERETVLDFTMGSGTTGVACKNLNRKFIGIELDEKYFNIAKDRIEKPKDELF